MFWVLILDGFINKTWEYEFWFDEVNSENLSVLFIICSIKFIFSLCSFCMTKTFQTSELG